MASDTSRDGTDRFPDPTLTDGHGRADYDSTLVAPVAYVVECPRCGERHETEKTWAYRCPECNKAIGVTL